MCFRSGFTLIELLVVVAIIALLAGMLFAGVKLVIESSRAARCASNLRQIKMGSDLYCADWENNFVPSNYDDGPGGLPTISATDLLLDYIEKTTLSINANTVWTCPSRKESPTQWPLTYGFNILIHVYYAAPGQTPAFINQAAIRRPAEVVEIADTAQSGPAKTAVAWISGTSWMGSYSQRNTLCDSNADWAANDDIGSYTVRYRHSNNQRANVCMTDGHVESVPLNKLLYSNFSISY